MVLEFAVNSDLEPELRSYCDEVRNINHAAEELVRNLSEAELLWKPGPGRWSIAQCLDHLVSAGRTEFKLIVAHEQRHILQAQRIKHRLPHITVP